MTRLLGCHVSAAGGMENAIKNAELLGANTIQIHPSPPQMWTKKPFKEGHETKFLEAMKESDVKSVFFHGIYLINLANTEEEKIEKSTKSLLYYLDLIDRIRGEGVIFHVGSMKYFEGKENEGYEYIIKVLNSILEKSENQGRLILEVSAGSGAIIGAKMHELAKIYEGIKDKNRVGFGLDSQHMWASGYDFQNNLEEIVAEMKSEFGLDKIWSIHLNDSKTDLASNKDRHENLGDGKIGWDALQAFINHPDMRPIPVILETPGLKEIETGKIEMDRLKLMAAGRKRD